jgi:hypothetical protein
VGSLEGIGWKFAMLAPWAHGFKDALTKGRMHGNSQSSTKAAEE